MTGVCGVGRWTAEMPITPEMEDICLKMKPDIEKKAGANFEVYIPLSFRTQFVSGKKHLVKVYVGVDQCVHAKITHALPLGRGELIVTVVQHPKTPSDPLISFDN